MSLEQALSEAMEVIGIALIWVESNSEGYHSFSQWYGDMPFFLFPVSKDPQLRTPMVLEYD